MAKKRKKNTPKKKKAAKPVSRKPKKAAPKKIVKKAAKKAKKPSVKKKAAKRAAPPPDTALPGGMTGIPCICIESEEGWFCMKRLPNGSLKECDGPFGTREDCESHTCS